MFRLSSVLVLGFVWVVSAGPASAEKALSKTAKEKVAKKACAMGDFQRGADILTDLFVDTNDPTYVYNQGRCYQQNNRFEQAVSRFREYLRKAKDLSDSDRAETERQIADCEEQMAKVAQVAPPPVAPLPPAAHVESPAPTPEPATPGVSNKPTPPLDGSQGKGLRVAGIVFAVVGVAAVGTGVGLAVKANSLSTKPPYSQSRENERASLKTWGWASYGVGAGAIATGTILYIVGWPSDQSSSVALLPVLAPGGASILLNGKF
jgi:tetratricopeptide (TPR) repeat protein